jgi:hypothetical protein
VVAATVCPPSAAILLSHSQLGGLCRLVAA